MDKKIAALLSMCVAVISTSAFATQAPPSEGDEEFIERTTPLPDDGSAAPEIPAPIPVEKPAPSVAPDQVEVQELPEAEDAKQPLEVKHRFNTALLQTLNKVTARTSDMEAPLGEAVRFGNLEIVAKSCWKSAPDERPENAAMLEIWELKPKEQPVRIYTGWMFSSSPALSAIEHPVYDISVLGCEDREFKE